MKRARRKGRAHNDTTFWQAPLWQVLRHSHRRAQEWRRCPETAQWAALWPKHDSEKTARAVRMPDQSGADITVRSEGYYRLPYPVTFRSMAFIAFSKALAALENDRSE